MSLLAHPNCCINAARGVDTHLSGRCMQWLARTASCYMPFFGPATLTPGGQSQRMRSQCRGCSLPNTRRSASTHRCPRGFPFA